MTFEIAILALLGVIGIRFTQAVRKNIQARPMPSLYWHLTGTTCIAADTLYNTGHFEICSIKIPKFGIVQKHILVNKRGAIALDVDQDIQAFIEHDTQIVVKVVITAVPFCDVEITTIALAPGLDSYELNWQVAP